MYIYNISPGCHPAEIAQTASPSKGAIFYLHCNNNIAFQQKHFNALLQYDCHKKQEIL
jgi:hypothetical protein